jgi:N-acetylgalactosamine-N,N'-diacetylbacillosaminyl-diphospho-undecaprenol 4-alpha-N-acetylgalactosaminyltransferase
LLNRFQRFKALKEYLAAHQFDFIIDFRVKNRFVQEFIIANYIYTAPYVMSVRSYLTDYYFPKNSFFAKFIYKNAYGIVTVSRAIEDKVKTLYRYNNVSTIYNPIAIENDSTELQINFPFIFGIGRMKNNVKQFDHLIKAYKNTIAREHNIKLLLAGDGVHKKELKVLVDKENLSEDVLFLGQVAQPNVYFRKALFTGLTSKNEGFPNVLLESLVNATPVVAYDCQSGPNEIIKDGHNGLLVKNQDINAFTIAINKMITDKDLYANCKVNAKSSLDKFSPDAIAEEWLKFLKIG